MFLRKRGGSTEYGPWSRISLAFFEGIVDTEIVRPTYIGYTLCRLLQDVALSMILNCFGDVN